MPTQRAALPRLKGSHSTWRQEVPGSTSGSSSEVRPRLARPAVVVALVPKASILKDGRALFKLGGNKCRLVVWVNYDYATVYTRLIGTRP